MKGPAIIPWTRRSLMLSIGLWAAMLAMSVIYLNIK